MPYSYKTWVTGEPIYASEINKASIGVSDALDQEIKPFLSPVGSVVAWLKSLTGCPALTAGWVECNGQTLSDADSPFNGVVIPNLNGASASTKRFLRGSATSGSAGGADTHTLTEAEMPAHTHSAQHYTTGSGSNFAPQFGSTNATPTTTSGLLVGTTGSGSAHNNLPSYYEVVWIMRVK